MKRRQRAESSHAIEPRKKTTFQQGPWRLKDGERQTGRTHGVAATRRPSRATITTRPLLRPTTKIYTVNIKTRENPPLAQRSAGVVSGVSGSPPGAHRSRLNHRENCNWIAFMNSLKENMRATCRCLHASIASPSSPSSAKTPDCGASTPPIPPPAPDPTWPPPPPAAHQIPPADAAPAPANESDCP